MKLYIVRKWRLLVGICMAGAFLNCVTPECCRAYSRLDVSSDSSPVFELKGGWEYYNNSTSSWESFKYPGRAGTTAADRAGAAAAGRVVLTRHKIPDGYWRDPCLFLNTDNQSVRVVFDNSIIYDSVVLPEKKIPDSAWDIVQLPYTISGKYLNVEMHSNTFRDSGVMIQAYIGSRSDLMTILLKADMPVTIQAFIFIFVGISTLILMKRRQSMRFMPLVLFSLFSGIWSFSETEITKLLLVDSVAFWSYISTLSGYLAPACFCISLNCYLPAARKKLLAALSIPFLVLAGLALLLDLTGLLNIGNTFGAYLVLLTASILVSGPIIAGNALRGDMTSKILLAGFTGLVLFVTYDILGWYLRLIPWSNFASGWGIMLFLLSTQFILNRKMLETENRLDMYSDELRLKDETLEVNEKQLKQALEYDRMKNEFISNVSHEFRTPLNILLANLQLMNYYVEDGSISSSSRNIGKYIKAMKQNCFRLLKLINNVIDITKIDSGGMSPVYNSCDVVKLIEELAYSAADYVKSRGLSLIFSSSSRKHVISCDQEKIERIVLNLLSNAVKFTGPGGTINISMDCLAHSFTVSVSDTGIGIPPEKLEMIFERFRQVDGSFTRSYEGSGIGLSLVHSLVDMLGGTVKVASEYGKGSIFTVTLPTIKAEAVGDPQRTSSRYQKDSKDVLNIEFSDIA